MKMANEAVVRVVDGSSGISIIKQMWKLWYMQQGKHKKHAKAICKTNFGIYQRREMILKAIFK